MVIRRLNIKAFGKFHNKEIAFADAVNVLEGRNEAGKSTLTAFIGAVLFGADEAVSKKYRPWLYRGSFGGSAELEESGKLYLLERDFEEEKVYLGELPSGERLEGDEAEARLKVLLGGLTAAGFANTVSIDQMKGTTDETISEELSSNLDNLSRAMSVSLDYAGAVAGLKEKTDEAEEALAAAGDRTADEARRALERCRADYDELLGYAWKARRNLEESAVIKNEAYERYEVRREDQLNRREDIGRRRQRISDCIEYWDAEAVKTGKVLAEKKERLEKAKKKGDDTFSAFAPRLTVPGTAAVLLIAAGCGAWAALYALGKPLWMQLTAGAVAAAGMLIVLISIIRSMRFRRRKTYFRGLAERQFRQEEYRKASKELLGDEAALLEEMAGEQSGEYVYACKCFEDAYDLFENINARLNVAAKSLDDAEAAYEAAEAGGRNAQRLEAELEAVSLAAEHLYAAGDKCLESFGRELLEKSGYYLSIITSGRYERLFRGTDMQVYVEGKDAMAEVSAVSRGTKEQVYLCLRLAAADLLSPDVSLPLILDDTFAFYDDERTARALKLLKQCGHQVILMTCHGREEKILKGL